MLFNITLHSGEEDVPNINKDIRSKLHYQIKYGSTLFYDTSFHLLFLFGSRPGGRPLNFLFFSPVIIAF